MGGNVGFTFKFTGINFTPFIYVIVIFLENDAELFIEESGGSTYDYYDQSGYFEFPMQWGLKTLFETQSGWSFSLNLMGLLGNALPSYGDVKMFMLAINVGYHFK